MDALTRAGASPAGWPGRWQGKRPLAFGYAVKGIPENRTKQWRARELFRERKPAGR